MMPVNLRLWLLLCIWLLSCYETHGGSYQLRSLDGHPCKVTVITDLVHSKLTIAYRQQAFCVGNVAYDEAEATVLAGSFLEVTYQLRVGSGMHVRMTALYCIRKDRLIESFHAPRENRSDQAMTYNREDDSLQVFDEHALFTAEPELVREHPFVLQLKVVDERRSKIHPLGDFSYRGNTVLNFDKQHCLFYTEHELLDGIFILYKENGESRKQSIKGLIPVIRIRGRAYYYVNGLWLERSHGSNFIMHSFNCG